MINVLIIDDDVQAADLTRVYIDHTRGFACCDIAHSIAQAKRMLAHTAGQIELVLLNKDIAHSNAQGLLSALCEGSHPVSIILLSTTGNFYVFNRESDPYRHRVVDYLLAPCQFTRLEHKLSAYREKALIYQQRLAAESQPRIQTSACSASKQRTLPKGLTRMTLTTVCRWIKSNQTQTFSTQMMADAIGISSVSCRKYLQYLSDTQMLSTQLHYGTAGRPMYLYRLLSNAA